MKKALFLFISVWASTLYGMKIKKSEDKTAEKQKEVKVSKMAQLVDAMFTEFSQFAESGNHAHLRSMPKKFNVLFDMKEFVTELTRFERMVKILQNLPEFQKSIAKREIEFYGYVAFVASTLYYLCADIMEAYSEALQTDAKLGIYFKMWRNFCGAIMARHCEANRMSVIKLRRLKLGTLSGLHDLLDELGRHPREIKQSPTDTIYDCIEHLIEYFTLLCDLQKQIQSYKF